MRPKRRSRRSSSKFHRAGCPGDARRLANQSGTSGNLWRTSEVERARNSSRQREAMVDEAGLPPPAPAGGHGRRESRYRNMARAVSSAIHVTSSRMAAAKSQRRQGGRGVGCKLAEFMALVVSVPQGACALTLSPAGEGTDCSAGGRGDRLFSRRERGPIVLPAGEGTGFYSGGAILKSCLKAVSKS